MGDYLQITVPRIDITYVKNLLKDNPNFNISDEFIYRLPAGFCKRLTLACYAVEMEDEELLDYLISLNVNLNVDLPYYDLPLFLAVLKKNLRFVIKLHKSGANINVQGIGLKRSVTAFFEAIVEGHFEIAKYLVDNGADINDVTIQYPQWGHTAVLIATSKGYDDIVELLLKNGAEPFATIQRSSLNVADVEQILSDSPNININSIFICKDTQDAAPLTLLHLAVKYESEQLVDYLISSNADLNICVPGHGTVLHSAVVKNDLNLVKKLIKSGANIHVQTAKWSVTPLIYAVEKGYLEVAKYLIEIGVDVNAKAIDNNPFNGSSALLVAIVNGFIDIVELLLNNNVDINCVSQFNYNYTPITYACHCEQLEIMQMLIARGAICNRDLLDEAVICGTPEILEYLLALDVDAIDIHFTEIEFEDPEVHSIYNFDKYNVIGSFMNESLRIMLDAGFNINIVDHFKELIDEDDDDDYDYPVLEDLRRHIVKLKVAGIYLCQRNIEAVEKGYDQFHTECHQEVEKLKNDKVGTSNLSFHRALRKSFHSLAIHLRHTDINDIVDKNKLIDAYPNYGAMIYYKLAKVNRRMKLLKEAEEFLDSILTYCLMLPYTFTREVYAYFTNAELKKLV